MRRTHLALVAGIAISLSSAAPASAAYYQGKSVDDHHYRGTVSNNDYGVYNNVEIRFQGDRAYITLASGGRLILNLDEERSSTLTRSPRAIRRGISWEIDVKDLHGR
jgi:hypothetical protein